MTCGTTFVSCIDWCRLKRCRKHSEQELYSAISRNMAEFHMLPSHKTESEYYSETCTNNPNLDDMVTTSTDGCQRMLGPYDKYEEYLINNWDVWNKEAEQRTLQHSRLTTASVPSLDHVSYKDFEEVYEPSDDTYLFLDALQCDLTTVRQDESNREDDVDDDNCSGNTMAPICLEIGCGSGVVSVFFRTYWLELQRLKNKKPAHLLSYVTDINPKALQITRRTFQQAMKCNRSVKIDVVVETNQEHQYRDDSSIGNVEYVLCDLATPLIHQLRGRVSYILCNPPYVPTDDEEVGFTDITAAYAGGQNGRRIIDRLIPQIMTLLSVRNGVAYLVTIDENLPLQLAINVHRQQCKHRFENLKHTTCTASTHQLQMKPFFRKRTKNEFLTIQKLTYQCSFIKHE
jgi:release factor glutamine methyltransferase